MPKDPYRYFRIEARELLDQLGSGVLDLEKGGYGADLPARLLRYAHTLKGAARVVKQPRIAELSHKLEDALEVHRDGAPAGRRSVDDILGLLDAIGAQLLQLPPAEATPTATADPDVAMRLLRSASVDVDVLLDGLGELAAGLASMRRSLAAIDQARGQAGSIAGQLASVRSSPGVTPAVKLDSLSGMADQLHHLIATTERSLAVDVEAAEREVRQVRDTAERLRLSPASSLFGALERTARDAAHSLGKTVNFQASGGDVRLDAQVLDTIQGALVQMVRNAVAHGIETEATRRAAGKPPAGKIALEVERRGYRVCFRCVDDGAGVDLDAVRRALQSKGLLAPDLQTRDEAHLLAHLLRGGISTSSKVTELAGRGIGLDVVGSAVRQLGGDVVARTTRGLGTTIELRVPVSLASLDVLSVQVGKQVAAIPLEGVRGTLRVLPRDVVHSPQGDSLLHEGRLIPLLPVELGTPHPDRARMASAQAARPAVVVSVEGNPTALLVDRLHGTERIVLRPLPALAVAHAIASGTYLHADGTPGLVLDPVALAAVPWRVQGEEVAAPSVVDPILIIDDSLTTRMLESSILQSAGFAVELAASGEEAMTLARNRRYALFLVDVEMPGMTGFEFIERTRADPGLREVPCILVTSRDSAEDRRRGEAAGASAHIAKNTFEQGEFLQRIGQLVRR